MEAALAALQQGVAELVAVLRANPGLLPSALAISAVVFLGAYVLWWLLSDVVGTLTIPTIVVPTTACERWRASRRQLPVAIMSVTPPAAPACCFARSGNGGGH